MSWPLPVTEDDPNGLAVHRRTVRPKLATDPEGELAGISPIVFIVSRVWPSDRLMTLLGLARYSITRPSGVMDSDRTVIPGNVQVHCLCPPVAVLITPSTDTPSNGSPHAEV